MNNSGVSLIAAVFLIVVLAFLGTMFISLIGTSSMTSVNDLQAARALAAAEGGREFEQRNLAQNLDWYRSATDPMTVTNRALGSGQVSVYSNLPATSLRIRMLATSNAAVRVYAIDRFPAAGCLRIDDEFIRYTGTGTTNGACGGPPPCFTGITRSAGACYGGGTQAAHSRGNAVFPVTRLGTTLPNNCNDMASMSITAHTKFLMAGTLDIGGEEISYGGSTTTGGTTTLTGIQRCLGGTASTASNINDPVTPVLDTGASAVAQAEIFSTGTVGSAVRIVRTTVQR